MVRSLQAVVLCSVAVLALDAGAAEPAAVELLPRQPIVEGRPVFVSKGCVHCHAVWGPKGESHVGPDLGRAASWRDLMQFAGSFWNHAPAMAEALRKRQITFPTLSVEETARLLPYLFYAKFLGEPGDAGRGRMLFEERSCARCHQIAGRGGTVGPRLDELATSMSSFFMAAALWNHGPRMAAKMAQTGTAWPHLDGSDVADIVALIRGAAGSEETSALTYVEAGSPRAGEALFQNKGCVRCHSLNGIGGQVGPDLGTQRPPLHAAEMAAELWNHAPAMWAKMKVLGVSIPQLDDAEMSDILAYLYFVRLTGAKGDPGNGRKVFTAAGCLKCHAAGGAGPDPDLTKGKAIRSPLYWVTAMWNHTPVMAKKAREAGVVWRPFADDEMRDLVTFLRLRAGAEPGK